MQFSDTTNKQGIIEDIDFLVDTDANNYTVANKTRNVNRWYDKVVSIILDSDGRWQFDDSNATDLPIGTTNLVDSQQDYTIDTTFLRILRVEVLDVNGVWNKMLPIDQADIYNQAMTEFLKTAGMPKYYDLQGSSVFLYPKPSSVNVTLTAGLKIYYQRNVSYFTSSDTTKTPGFAPMYHRYLSLGAALDWAIKKQLPQKSDIAAELQQTEQDIRNFYALHNKDEKIQLTARINNPNAYR